MKKTTIYTLLSMTTMISTIALATDQEVSESLKRFEKTLPATPEHINTLTAQHKYDHQTPYTKKVQQGADGKAYRREKDAKLVAKRSELETELSEKHNEKAMARAQEQHDRELEELTLKLDEITLNEGEVTRALDILREEKEDLEARCGDLEAKKSQIATELQELALKTSQIERSRDTNVGILETALEEVDASLRAVNLALFNSQKQVRELEQKNNLNLLDAKNIMELKERLLGALTKKTPPVVVSTERSKEFIIKSAKISKVASSKPNDDESNSDDEFDLSKDPTRNK